MNLKRMLRQHLLWLHRPESKFAQRANLSDIYMRYVNLSSVNLSHANFSSADLRCADMRYADLSGANLSVANLSVANLSGAKGLLSPYEFLKDFARTAEGIIVYKSFGEIYGNSWSVTKGLEITEVCNPNPIDNCGCGINVASLEWCQDNCKKEIWECVIPYGAQIVVPYSSDGKFRTERIKVIKNIGVKNERCEIKQTKRIDRTG